MIKEGAVALRDRNRFINARAMGVASLEDIRAIVLQQNIFTVIDVAGGLAIGHFFNASAQAIIAIGRGRDGGGISGGKFFDLHQPVLGVIALLRVIARREQRLSREIPVVVVLVGKVAVGRELVPGIDDTAIGRAVADRIVGKGLRIEQQGMAGSSQPIQRVVAKALHATSVNE